MTHPPLWRPVPVCEHDGLGVYVHRSLDIGVAQQLFLDRRGGSQRVEQRRAVPERVPANMAKPESHGGRLNVIGKQDPSPARSTRSPNKDEIVARRVS